MLSARKWPRYSACASAESIAASVRPLIGEERAVPRWSSSSTRQSASARSIHDPPRPVGRGAPNPGPPWKNTIQGSSSRSRVGVTSSRANSSMVAPPGASWSTGTVNMWSVTTSPGGRWVARRMRRRLQGPASRGRARR